MRLFAPRMTPALTDSGNLVMNGFITVNNKPVVKATFDLSQCPQELVADMIRILELSAMKLKKAI